MTLCRPTTEQGHCSACHACIHCMKQRHSVRHACVQRCRGNWTEKSGTGRRPSLCVDCTHVKYIGKVDHVTLPHNNMQIGSVTDITAST
jgi:hypothetical protein